MLKRLVRQGLIAFLLLTALPTSLRAQEAFDLSGVTYLDYFYTLSSPTEAEEGFNGFTYRRLYLTADFLISEDFSARARLEAGDGQVLRGPTPFVKDLYLNWEIGGGHALRAGVFSPPVYQVSESVWDYRSLEQTVMDLFGIVDSRDMGVGLSGPLLGGGTLQYAFMVGNNNHVRPEDEPGKRIYGQLQAFPAEGLAFTLGADYADYTEELEQGLTLNGFAGYTTGVFQVGLEGFWNQLTNANNFDTERMGLSLFGAVHVVAPLELVARFDRVRTDPPGVVQEVVYTSFALVGLSYMPHPQVRIIPNLHLLKDDHVEEADLLGRVTLDFVF